MTSQRAHATSRRLTANGLRLHYLEWGDPAAPPLVCLHSFTGSARDFTALARHLQDRYRIMAFDLRGHGDSGWSPHGAYEYSDQVADLAAIVDQLELPSFTLIGTAMGGVTAMAYAAAHSDRLGALVINDIGPDEEPGTQGIMHWVDKRPHVFRSLPEALAYYREAVPSHATRSEEDQLDLLHGVLKEAARGRWVWRMDPAGIQQRAEHGALKRPSLWPALGALSCPVLIVWGTNSQVLSEAQARRMVETVPHGELVRVVDRGHAPTLVEPEALTAIESLLTRLAK